MPRNSSNNSSPPLSPHQRQQQVFGLHKMGPPLDSKTWLCCFGLHVRTATVLIGLWHLFLNFSVLVLLAILLRHPEMIQSDSSDMDDVVTYSLDNSNEVPQALPTPLSKVEAPYAYRETSKLSYQNIDMGVMACLCMMAITMLLITGVLKGKPSHLLPFFSVQLFDFAVTTLTATSYVCYLRNIHRIVADSNNMPWRESILQLSPNMLALLVLLSFICTILLKMYVIGIVWRCYKYLTFRRHNAQLMLPYVIPSGAAAAAMGGHHHHDLGGHDSGHLNSEASARAARDYSTLLPGYEEALAQSMKQQPPPSYQVAMAAAPAPATATQMETTSQAATGADGTTMTGVTVILPPAPVASAQAQAQEASTTAASRA